MPLWARPAPPPRRGRPAGGGGQTRIKFRPLPNL